MPPVAAEILVICQLRPKKSFLNQLRPGEKNKIVQLHPIKKNTMRELRPVETIVENNIETMFGLGLQQLSF